MDDKAMWELVPIDSPEMLDAESHHVITRELSRVMIEARFLRSQTVDGSPIYSVFWSDLLAINGVIPSEEELS